MTSAGEKALNTAIKKRVFDPVYYLFGEDDFLKDTTTRELIEAAVEPSTRDFNLEIRRASELDAEGLDSLLSTPPMLASKRVVVLREVDKLKKAPRALLDRYLARPAHDTVLVLVAPAGVKEDKALSERSTSMDYKPLTGDRLPKWVSHYAQSSLGCTITPDAIALLIEATGGEVAQLAVELAKLASSSTDTIDERAVADMVGVRRGESLGDFLDAVAAKDARTALDLIPIILQLPKTSGVSVVMALASQTIALAYGEAMLSSGVSQQGLFGELMALLKQTGAFPMRPWTEAVTAWSRYSSRWTTADLDAALSVLVTTDAALKDTRLSSPEQLLTTVVLALCGGSARHAA